MSREKRIRRKKRGFFKFLRWVVVLTAVTALAFTVFILYNPLLARFDLSSLLERNRRASIILDRNGEEVITLNPTRIIWVELEKMPRFLRQAVIAVEDQRFYEHRGVDFRGIIRALYQNIRYGRAAQGGSTITQQLAKNLFLTREKTITRKVAEIGYAVRIDREYSKDQILEYYLNYIYLGHGNYGVEAASRFYFDRHVWELEPGQIALLVSVIRGPEYYSPVRHPENALERRNLVLAVLRDQDLLTEREYRGLREEPLAVRAEPDSIVPGGYFADFVEEQLARDYGWTSQYIRSAGLKIHTTLDLYMQRAAEDIVSSLPRDDEGGPEGALVALSPATGEILAMVGGRNYRLSRLNRAVEIRRQIGSAIKPLVFAAAVEAGYSPETYVLDEPTVFMINGREWRPQNFDNRYRGYITLRQGLEESVNIVSVRLVNELGINQVFSFIERMGLPLDGEGPRNDRSLAPLSLGGLTEGVTLLELARSFTPLANQGRKSEPLAVLKVEDSQGRLLRKGRFRQEQVIQPRTAFLVTEMMKGVITRGTGVRANPGRPAAGKTGTTNNNTDAWFIGYTPDLLAVLWMGNDDRRPLRVDGRVIGSGTAAEYWGAFMRQALVRKPVRNFPAAPQ